MVDGDRYVTVSACMAHSCDDKALIWTDAKDRVGLFALSPAENVRSLGASPFAIGSRIAAPGGVSAAFWQSFKRWRLKADADGKHASGCITFVALDGTVTTVTAPQ